MAGATGISCEKHFLLARLRLLRVVRRGGRRCRRLLSVAFASAGVPTFITKGTDSSTSLASRVDKPLHLLTSCGCRASFSTCGSPSTSGCTCCWCPKWVTHIQK
ncbi:uncharacterized protein LOC144099137 isoform X2 [Amblyomma americanum]